MSCITRPRRKSGGLLFATSYYALPKGTIRQRLVRLKPQVFFSRSYFRCYWTSVTLSSTKMIFIFL